MIYFYLSWFCGLVWFNWTDLTQTLSWIFHVTWSEAMHMVWGYRCLKIPQHSTAKMAHTHCKLLILLWPGKSSLAVEWSTYKWSVQVAWTTQSTGMLSEINHLGRLGRKLYRLFSCISGHPHCLQSPSPFSFSPSSHSQGPFAPCCSLL